MKYDFTSHMERQGHDALAYDIVPYEDAEVKKNIKKIPMWVADMNFPVFPGIIESMDKRLHEPHFGYYNMSDEYYERIINWHNKRYGTSCLEKEDIDYENGVLGCLASTIRAVTKENDSILLNAPVYTGFIKTIENLNRNIVLSHLKKDENKIYRFDLKDMETKIKENNIRLAVICSPHNPTGRVWTKKELNDVMALYKKYNCIVVSDEIWADIVMPGFNHIPLYSLSEDAKQRSICMYAPSKTFNLAGLIGAYHVIGNKKLRDKIEKISLSTHYNYCNVLSMHALYGAYSLEGAAWTDELIETLKNNILYAYRFFTEELKDIEVTCPEGTYMLLIDCSMWCTNNKISFDSLVKRGIYEGVIWQDAEPFYAKESIRLNLALPFDILKEAVERLRKNVFILK